MGYVQDTVSTHWTREKEKKKKEKILTSGKFPTADQPSWVKTPNFLTWSISTLTFIFSSASICTSQQWSPTPNHRSPLSLSLTFVDRRCQSSSSPFLPISLKLSLSLPRLTSVLNQNRNFFSFSFHYASHLLTCPVAWAFSFTALRP